MKLVAHAVALVVFAAATAARADEPSNMQQASPVPLAPDGRPLATRVTRLDPALDRIIDANAKVTVAKGQNYFGVIEGSAWVADGKSGYLLFTDFAANVIYKWAPDARQLSVYLEKAGFTGKLADIAYEGRMTTTQYAAPLYVYDIGANGIALDPQGRVVMCAQGDRQLVRLEKDGTRTVLASEYQGHRFNHTNSMVIKSNGTIYMTDSRAGVHVPDAPAVADSLPLSVYRVKDGTVSLAIPDRGHGLAFSPDEKIFYAGIGNRIMRYDVQPDDTLANGRVFIDMSGDNAHGGPNQLAVDSAGNVYSGGPGGLWIMKPDGTHIGTISLPAIAAGLAFGDADLKTLYVIDSRNLLQVRTKIPGMRLPARLTQPVLRQGHGIRAADDARENAVLAACKNPPSAPTAPGSRPALAMSTRHDYTVTEIPGVIAAGQQWKELWQDRGNDADSLTFLVADGIMAADDGGILVPQAEKNQVLELTLDGKTRVIYRDTHTGGALSRNKKGVTFIAQRELNPAIAQLAPKRKLLANRYQNDPLDCLGVGLNDLTTDSKGGAYFTMGGLYYADVHGTITKYGENLRTNGLILSPDEKILYVTNAATLVAFDVQPNGSLTNQRDLITLPDGPGDGLTIDSDGRIYVTGGGVGVRVIAPDGKYLGTIPTPYGAQSVTFGGPGKKTLFALMSVSWDGHTGAQIVAIPMLAQGYTERAK